MSNYYRNPAHFRQPVISLKSTTRIFQKMLIETTEKSYFSIIPEKF